MPNRARRRGEDRFFAVRCVWAADASSQQLHVVTTNPLAFNSGLPSMGKSSKGLLRFIRSGGNGVVLRQRENALAGTCAFLRDLMLPHNDHPAFGLPVTKTTCAGPSDRPEFIRSLLAYPSQLISSERVTKRAEDLLFRVDGDNFSRHTFELRDEASHGNNPTHGGGLRPQYWPRIP